MWVAAERPPRTRAARLFVFSRTCVIISKPVTPCKTFRGNMAEFFNRLLGAIGAGTPGKFQAPSDLYIKGYSTPIGVDFVLRQIADLRKVYCDVDTIKERE